MISDELGLKITSDCDFEDYVFEGHHNVSKSCTDAIEAANRIVGDYINNYDVILDVCYPSIVEQELRLRRYVSTPPPPPLFFLSAAAMPSVDPLRAGTSCRRPGRA